MKKSMICCLASVLVWSGAAWAGEYPADPLDSPMWDYRANEILGDAEVVFDNAVQVIVPQLAENQHVFPVTVDASALPDVKRIVIFADLNPIPVAIDYRPINARAFVATRIKLDQRTPVRAAVQTGDGRWHVSGIWVDAAGGGCSAPPVSRVKGDWAQHLGEMRGAAWPDHDDTRIRVSFRHPMDTGLVENISAYNIDTLSVTAADGTKLAEMSVFGAVAEDPVFTMIVKDAGEAPIAVSARDTAGLEFDGSVSRRAGVDLLAQAR